MEQSIRHGSRNSPLAGYQIAATMQEYDAYVRHDEADAWVAITLPYSGQLDANEHAFQLMFMHNSTQPALLDEVQVTISTGGRAFTFVGFERRWFA